MELRNWEVVDFGRSKHLLGEVYDSPVFPEGQFVRTSQLIGFDTVNMVAKTANSIYHLNEPNPKFVEWLSEQGKSIKDLHTWES